MHRISSSCPARLKNWYTSEGTFPGVVRYRPRTEGLFARIDFHRDAENSFWDIRTRDGVRSLYGVPTDGPTVTRDPNASRSGRWHFRVAPE